MPLRLSSRPRSPATTTSSSPSSGVALGATRMPPAKYWQLATTTCWATTSRASPATTAAPVHRLVAPPQQGDRRRQGVGDLAVDASKAAVDARQDLAADTGVGDVD